MSDVETPILLGRITGVYGVRGWVKVHSDTEPRDNIVRYPVWQLLTQGAAGPGRPVRRMSVLDGREQGKTVVARLEGIEDRDAAAALIGCTIAVDRTELPALEGDGFYWTDLLGMEVVTRDDVRIGRVSRMFETGANDVMVVRDERSDSKPGAEVLVPWVRPDVITLVDVGSRRITIDWDPDF